MTQPKVFYLQININNILYKKTFQSQTKIYRLFKFRDAREFCSKNFASVQARWHGRVPQ